MKLVESGEADPGVLFLHGAGVGGWMWRPVLDRLGDGVAPLVPDLPGFGRNAGGRYVSHEATVAELAASVRARAPGGVHVVGFSLGAQLAILLACRCPGLVRGVVVVSGEVVPMRLPRLMTGLVSATAPLAAQKWFARAQGRQLSVPEELMDDYLRDSATISRETLVAAVGENIRFRLPSGWGSVGLPVAVLVGERERGVMRRSAQLIADAAPGSSLRVVEGAGHDIPFTHPELVAGTIRDGIAPAG